MSDWFATNLVERDIDHHARVNVLAEDEDGYWYNTNTVAVRSWKRATRWLNSRTRLHQCVLCGRLGSSRRVSYRSLCYEFLLAHSTITSPMLCMGCWNRVRPLARRYEELQELRAIAKRMQRGDFRDGQQDDR